MAKELSLVAIQALAVETSYGGLRDLKSLTAATLLSAAVLLQDYNHWYGAGVDLTASEKDEIDALVADILNDILEEAAPMSQVYVKLGERVYESDTVLVTLPDLDPTDCRIMKIFVSGMLSDFTGLWAARVGVYLNGIQTTGIYTAYGRFFQSATMTDVESNITEDAMIFCYPAAAQPQTEEFFGVMEITLFNPTQGMIKHLQYDAMVGRRTAAQMARIIGQGTAEINGNITEIALEPYDGNTFLIDATSDVEPDELRITVYGLK